VTVQCHTKQIDASEVECPEGLSLELDGGLYINAPHTHSPSKLTLRYADGELMLAGARLKTCDPSGRSWDDLVLWVVGLAPQLAWLNDAARL
jgi:hypothetical protein